MPYKPLKPCRHRGCPNLTDGIYCEAHRKLYSRPSAHKRGYTYRWNIAAKQYLREHPLCAIHLKRGHIVQATVVDHIKPHKGDMALFWDKANWQALCKECHDIKTAKEDGGFGRKGASR